MEKQIEDWLHNYNYIKAFIKELEDEAESKITEGMGSDTSREPLSRTYKFSSTVENVVINSEKTSEILEGNKNLIKKLDSALGLLSDIKYKVIKNRCIDNKFYYQFSYDIGLSDRSCKRIKKAAIEDMRKVIFGA